MAIRLPSHVLIFDFTAGSWAFLVSRTACRIPWFTTLHQEFFQPSISSRKEPHYLKKSNLPFTTVGLARKYILSGLNCPNMSDDSSSRCLFHRKLLLTISSFNKSTQPCGWVRVVLATKGIVVLFDQNKSDWKISLQRSFQGRRIQITAGQNTCLYNWTCRASCSFGDVSKGYRFFLHSDYIHNYFNLYGKSKALRLARGPLPAGP
jgi:hypothetical protein